MAVAVCGEEGYLVAGKAGGAGEFQQGMLTAGGDGAVGCDDFHKDDKRRRGAQVDQDHVREVTVRLDMKPHSVGKEIVAMEDPVAAFA